MIHLGSSNNLSLCEVCLHAVSIKESCGGGEHEQEIPDCEYLDRQPRPQTIARFGFAPSLEVIRQEDTASMDDNDQEKDHDSCDSHAWFGSGQRKRLPEPSDPNLFIWEVGRSTDAINTPSWGRVRDSAKFCLVAIMQIISFPLQWKYKKVFRKCPCVSTLGFEI